MTDSAGVRLAILIDADNTSAARTADLLEEVAKYGTPTVKRAYGDWTGPRLSGWKDELNRHAIQPMQQFAYTTGKNATDSALIIDAMDLLYSGNVDAFAIVSSDSDFTRLASRLRESGKVVYGFGQRKTPEAFVAACNRFIFVEVLGAREAVADDGDDQAAPLPDLRPLLTKAVEATSQDDGWANLSAIGSWLGNSQASFDPRNYGFSKLSVLIREQPFLETAPAGASGALRVRVTPGPEPDAAKGPAQKRTKAAAQEGATPDGKTGVKRRAATRGRSQSAS